MKINTNVELDVEDFAISLDYGTALEVILAVDKEQQNLDFTHECAVMFVKALLYYSKEDITWLDEIKKLIGECNEP